MKAATAVAVLIGTIVPAAAAPGDDVFVNLDKVEIAARAPKPEDHLAVDRLLAAKSADVAPTTTNALAPLPLDAEAWAPGHAPGLLKPSVQSHAGPSEPAINLGPDEAIKVPPPAPAHDPLDVAKPTTDAAAKSPTDALPPLAAAIKSAVGARAGADIKGPRAAERRKERDAIGLFYAAHAFAPLWSQDGKPIAAVEPVIARLARAGEDALTLPLTPAKLKMDGTAAEMAESDIALTEAVVAYARQATGARVDPAAISPLIGARPNLANPGEVLETIVSAGIEAGDKLQALNPTDPRYLALRQKLAEVHVARAPESDLPIPSGPTLRIGMRDPRVPLIRSRFSLDSIATDEHSELEYDTQVAEAVADFQKANGISPSGVLTKRTIEALSGGHPSRLDATIAANMEMWRWMPRDLGRERIEVNVPDYVVTVYHDDVPVAQNRVVVGKTDTPTPLFSNTMKYLIVNPVWNVPDSIIKKEFLPKSGGDASYIAAHGFDVSYSRGRLVVKQPAGAKNALGRIKFIFPNDYSVYLHDTPSKSLFAASRRAFSHGCVRVDQPFDFAEMVLNDGVPEGGKVLWSKKRLQSMLGDKERYVDLPKPLPIHIEYFTASVDPDSGHLRLKDDIYDYARKVAAALGADG